MRNVSTRGLLLVFGLIAGAVGGVLLLAAAGSTATTTTGGALLVAGWAVLAALAVDRRRPRSEMQKLRAELNSHDARQLERTRRIEAAIEAERAKESRHEYVQEQALERIESRLREAAASPGASRVGPKPERTMDVLFVTSNGAGLGHLTRLLAVAGRMGDEYDIEFLTLSRAYDRVTNLGYSIRYFPSAEATEMGTRLWNATFRHYLQDLVAETMPKVVVFDGTVVYEGLVDVCRGHLIPLIWMQRGCWKPEAEQRYPIRRNAARVADHVIIPGDYACDESVDVGKGVPVTSVGPIVLTSEDEMLSAEDALAELGLSTTGRHVLFNLGGGSLSDSSSHLSVLREVAARSHESTHITVLRSPLAEDQVFPSDINLIHRYPISKFARAFDVMVAAAGYNTVQEAAGLRIPTILVPNDATQTDDQGRRAQSAVDQGWALSARAPWEVADRVLQLIEDDGLLSSIRKKLAVLPAPTGGVDAAMVVKRVIHDAIDLNEATACN